jgi:malate dehydrogenase (oxaloacetate-decarboxylating)
MKESIIRTLKQTIRMPSHKSKTPHLPHPKYNHLPLSTSGPVPCALTGSALLNTPYFNKGVAFPSEERATFKLTGLLPQNIADLDTQVKRAYQQYSSRQDDLAKNTFMTSLAEQNQVLYFRVSTLFHSVDDGCYIRSNSAGTLHQPDLSPFSS